MRFTSRAALLLLLLTTSVPNFTGQNTVSPDEQTIRNLENEWYNAYSQCDADAAVRIEAGDFTVSGSFGQRTKKQQLDRIRSKECQAEQPRKPRHEQFRFYGNVALATGVRENRDSESGSKADFGSQFTELWVKRNGHWKVVHAEFVLLEHQK